MTIPDQTHQKFLENLRASDRAVQRVAEWLESFGYEVMVNRLAEAPAHAQWQEYADRGDIVIRQRIEVKQISRAFTGPQDWPFGKKFIVCAKHSYDRARPKPYAYFIVSADGCHFACVDTTSTSRRWYVETRRDVRYGDYSQEFYLCPMELVKWGRLEKR